MSTKIVPLVYKPIFEKLEAQKAIKLIKDNFEKILAEQLNLIRVSAPLVVPSDTGINDLLNGVERPVEFDIKETKRNAQIVQSLAKWKRMALKKYGFKPGEGLYTDMNAIRRDEDTDNLHSIYVDQWDWERIITKEERNLEFLKKIVRLIFEAFKKTEDIFVNAFPEKKLKSGKVHDGRSPDYDDWELNGDILLWYEPLGVAIELSSMGIRVDPESLDKQLKEANADNRRELLFHKMLLNGELPLTIGGGLGQSRICMYFMKTVHIGEVQASVWPEEMVQEFRAKGIEFL